MTSAPTHPLRIVLIDDCDLATEGIRALLAPYADRVVLIEPRAALAAPAELDVILFEPMDLSGMAASMLRDLQASFGGVSAVFSWAGRDALPATTVSTHLTKRLSASQLVRTLEDLVEGRHVQVLPSRVPAAVVEAPAPEEPVAVADGLENPLTPREADMIALITSGRSNLEISEHLGVSINSVKTYIRSAYRKIGITRRSQAVLWGVTHGYDVDDGAAVTA